MRPRSVQGVAKGTIILTISHIAPFQQQKSTRSPFPGSMLFQGGGVYGLQPGSSQFQPKVVKMLVEISVYTCLCKYECMHVCMYACTYAYLYIYITLYRIPHATIGFQFSVLSSVLIKASGA